MSKTKLLHKTTNSSRWFHEEVRKQKRLYDLNIRKGAVDKGYLWASLYLHIFIEGVFTMRPVPSQIEVEVPKGVFRLTALQREDGIRWIIRNDTFGCLAEAKPQEIGEWAVETYPEGIGGDGYLLIVHQLLTAGCNDESKKQEIWDAMFYEEVENAA